MLKLACDIITFGLLVWVCYNTVVLIRDGWRDYNQTFPRVYPGKPAAGDPLGQIGDYNRTFPREYPGDREGL